MSATNISKWLRRGVELHQAGRLAEAQRLYGKVLKTDTRNPDALNLTGLVAAHGLHYIQALAFYDRAIAAYPGFADAHYNRGVALAALARNVEAVDAYARAIYFQPAHADARLNAGTVLHKMNRTNDAIAAFRAMTQFCPDDWRGFYNLGSCLSADVDDAPDDTRADQANEAVATLTRAMALHPESADVRLSLARAQAQRGDNVAAAETQRGALEKASTWTAEKRAEVLSTLGEYLRKQHRYEDSIASHQQALALCPDGHLFQFNLAAALYDAGRHDESERLYKQAIETKPDFANAYINLGNIYRDRNEPVKAISAFEKALTFGPAFQAYTNIGAAMYDLGWASTSLMIHDKAISLEPAQAATHYYRALALLSLARFAPGWAEHEARFDVDHVETSRRPGREWKGEDLSGKRILIWTEQGMGDQILHGSMIPDLIPRAGHVVIECASRLAPIFARSFPAATVVGRTRAHEAPVESEACDFQIAAGSLGQYLRRDLASFPARPHYLYAAPERIEGLRRKYLDLAQGRRLVGIAWRSRNPRMGTDKSTELADLAPVLQTEKIFFVNLQYGDCAEDIADARARTGVDIYQDPDVDQLKDMDAFFAQVAAMDLVVTTSNTTAHVAGSQGVPTRLLLRHSKGLIWYWFHHRPDSPWYPSVKIFRAQAATMDQNWAIQPARDIASELAAWPARLPRDVP